jgi:hypothetical protein
MKILLAVLAGLAAGFLLFDPEGTDKVSNGAEAFGEWIDTMSTRNEPAAPEPNPNGQ